MADLFRQEVVARRAAEVFDGVVIRSSARSTLLSVAALLLALSVVAAACLGTHTRKQRVAGALVPDAGLVTVVAPRAGTVAHVAVADGDEVARDQPLFVLAAATDDTAQLDLLLGERAALTARIAAERELAARERTDLERRAAFSRDQAAMLAEQRAAAERRAALLRVDVDRLERLAARGHVAANLLDLRLGELLDARQQAMTLRREQERHLHDADGFDDARATLPAKHDAGAAELHMRAFALDRAIAAAEARWAHVVRAPTAGRVEALRVHAGTAIAAGAAALSLVPADSALQAELLLPAAAAGFVAPGQQVRVRYDAYPYQKFGLHPAVVRSVGRAPLDADARLGAMYRVVADIDSQVVHAYGDVIPLRPGLTLQADIVRDRRRVIEWLFEPVITAIAR